MNSQELLSKIQSHLRSGGVVQLTTYIRSTLYSAKHADWFRINADCVEVRNGRNWSTVTLRNGQPVLGIKFGREV
jgi:hypothetical protein